MSPTPTSLFLFYAFTEKTCNFLWGGKKICVQHSSWHWLKWLKPLWCLDIWFRYCIVRRLIEGGNKHQILGQFWKLKPEFPDLSCFEDNYYPLVAIINIFIIFTFPDPTLKESRKSQQLGELAFANGANGSPLCAIHMSWRSEALHADPKQMKTLNFLRFLLYWNFFSHISAANFFSKLKTACWSDSPVVKVKSV